MNNHKSLPVIIFVILFLGVIIYLIVKADINTTPKFIDHYTCYWDQSLIDESHVARESHDKQYAEFFIKTDQTPDQIAQNLYKADILDQPDYFVCYLKKSGTGEKIQAGYFKLPYDLTMVELAQSLQNASLPSVVVTIPEGLMMKEIANTIDKALGNESEFDKSRFLKLVKDSKFIKTLPAAQNKKSLEGYLFPDTYDFYTSDTEEEIITKMVNNFEDRILTQYATELANSKYAGYQVLKLASIVEREARASKDRKMVADILLRRLEKGWLLEVDATILYYFQDWTHKITAQDLADNHAYNTRKRKGLPPTPICNPGEDSIKAVLFPAPNKYWFYISDKQGKMHYAKTLSEHNANINKYLK